MNSRLTRLADLAQPATDYLLGAAALMACGKADREGQMKLKVIEANWNEVFIDTVRIPGKYRLDAHGEVIENGTLVRLDAGDRYVLVIARGQQGNDQIIQMDEFTRRRLGGVAVDAELELTMRPATIKDQLFWYVHATNPAVRIPALVAMISLGLGAISVALGIWSVCLSYR